LRKPKIRELKEAFRALFKGADTTRFPLEPVEPVEGYRGKPEFQEECIGCGACAEVCPSGAIELSDNPEVKIRSIWLHLDRCIFCGQCVRNCATGKGIIQSQEFELSVFDRGALLEKIERRLVVCEVCGTVIGTEEHILWVGEKLGALVYGNPMLLLLSLSERGLVDRLAPLGRLEDITRGDRIRVSCPTCRRLTVVKS